MNITFIGGGKMADALIGGLLRKGFSAASLRAVEISPEARARLGQKYGVDCVEHVPAARDGEIFVFSVKPQQMREAATRAGFAADANLVITIAAGITLTSLSRWLGGHRRLVRAMPNTPALIGEGVTGLHAMDRVTREDRERTESILGAVGSSVWIEAESHMDAVTAVSGSGPAYVFYFMEAMEEAARQLGLPEATARKLAIETFTGAAKLAAESADPAAVLRARVTSKGGTTEAALASMEGDQIGQAIVRAIHKANQRGRELGELLDKG